MSKEPKEYLRHIHDECLYIISVSENLLFEDFIEDETLKRELPGYSDYAQKTRKRLVPYTW